MLYTVDLGLDPSFSADQRSLKKSSHSVNKLFVMVSQKRHQQLHRSVGLFEGFLSLSHSLLTSHYNLLTQNKPVIFLVEKGKTQTLYITAGLLELHHHIIINIGPSIF